MRVKKSLVVLVFLLFAAGCAPQKVRIYESAPGIRSDIVQTSLALIGKPYRSGAKGPESFDCSGFVYFVFKQSRITLPVNADAIMKMGYEIPRESVQPGDLVFFRINKEYHVGIMLNGREFAHASKTRGVAVDDVDATYWKRYFISLRTVL